MIQDQPPLRTELEFYKTLYEAAPCLYFSLDPNGVIRSVNAFGADRLGYSPNELIGQLILSLTHPEDQGRLQQALAAIAPPLAAPQNAIDTPWRCRQLCKNGSVLWGKAIAKAHRHIEQPDQPSQILFLVWPDWRDPLRDRLNLPANHSHQVAGEVLEKDLDQAMELLQKSLEFDAMLKRITDRVRDSLDEAQIMQAAVRELTLVLGASCCNAAIYDLGRGTSTICYEYAVSIPASQGRVAQMDNFPELYSQLLNGNYFQFCSVVPNPVRGRVAMLACPIQDDQGVLGDLWLINHCDYAFSDSEIRLVQQTANQCAIAIRQARLYQKAQAQVRELEKLNVLKDDFLSTVSHELRTPMANMRLAIQMLEVALSKDGLVPNLGDEEVTAAIEEMFGRLTGKTNRYLQILRNECEREISLINDLLDLQQLDYGSQSLSLVEIRLQDWLPQAVEPFYERARNRQQKLEVHVPAKLPLLVSDRANLGRIVAELLNNACKYTPAGETISLSVVQKTKLLEIKVANSGIEIPPHELPRIFDKFYRVPSADPWKQGGTGLGLALVQRLASLLGGSVHVDSKNRLTCFTISLPQLDRPKSVPIDERTDSQEAGAT